MAEQVNQSAPVDQNKTVVDQAQTTEQTDVSDLLSRSAQIKPESQKPSNSDESIFDYKEIDKIADPTAKAIAEKAYKSMQSGFTKKFQEVADLRKQLESQANQKKVWTADAIQKELLSDPTFVSEAQRLASVNPNIENPNNSGMSDQEWSALTPTEKAKFTMLEGKINQLEQQNQRANLQQQHQVLKSKYPNYAPDVVDTTVKEIFQGKKQITLEDVYKAMDYEEMAKRVYELGRQDAMGKVNQKVQSMSFDGGQSIQSGPAVEAVKGESNLNFFQRIARARLAESKINR